MENTNAKRLTYSITTGEEGFNYTIWNSEGKVVEDGVISLEEAKVQREAADIVEEKITALNQKEDE